MPRRRVLYFLVLCLAEVGEFAEGIACGDEALRLAEAVDQPYSLSIASLGIGVLYLRQGEYRKAITALERGFRLCQTYDIRNSFPRTVTALGLAHALAGRVAEALSLIDYVVRPSTPHVQLDLAEVYLVAGRLEDACQLALRLLALCHTCKQRGIEAWTLRLLGDIEVHRDPPGIEQAETYYQQALALAEKLGMRPLQAHCHRGLGMLYRQSG